MLPKWDRVDGRVVCGTCDKEYKRHPLAKEDLDFQGNPWLRRLCDGRLVKT